MSKRFNETAEAIKLSQSIQKLSGLKSGTVVPIPLEYIDRSENIRESIDDQSLEFQQLVDSIKEVGLLQNPVVTIVSGKILCVSGHRRLAAMAQLKTEKVPCSVVHFDNLEKKDLAQILENTARKSLDPFELGDQLLRLKERGFSQVKLQELIGKNRQVVGRYQKIAKWPKKLRKIVLRDKEKFNIKKLMVLAAINDHDVLETEIQKISGSIKARQGATSEKKKRYPLQRSNFDKYCSANNYDDSQVQFLSKALIGLNLLEGEMLLD